ncbi:MAG: chromosomal replication initiator protein DnaA [Pseudomonadota bacterium]|nr:chromosomal replication initiator protein DnaA [Pseudomonadota bacterium]
MATNNLSAAITATPPGTIWIKASRALKNELGEDAFGSWLAPAALRPAADGALCLVTPTGIARDWIRRYAWRRIGELWAANDPEGRCLSLKSRLEFDAECSGSPTGGLEIEATNPVSTDAAPGPAAKTCAAGGLQERFRFETFVAGPANEFAHAVARRVASWVDGHFNPVVFHGPYGFGKTHLLNALAWEAMRCAPSRKVVYLTAERFLSSFVRALMERRMAAFKDELRSADLLLIDDVHFIGGKQSTQEELFHTLAALMEDGRRVVFSAVRPPAALSEIDARLRSHLSAGLVCGIDPADRSLRLGILDRKLKVLAHQQGFSGSLRPEVLAFLADRFTDSVRELEGALNTLIVRAGAGVGAVSLDEAQCLLRPHLRGAERRVTVDEIQKAASEHFGLKQADLISQTRTRAVARPRQAAMWLAKQLTTRSLPDIGRRFGGRDHTTVLHAVRRIEELRAADPQLARDLEVLVRKLRG